MSRKNAREYVFQATFEYLFLQNKTYDFLSFIKLDTNLSESDIEFIKTSYESIIENYDFLVSKIKQYAKNFKIDRIFKADLAILLTAMNEMYFAKNIPQAVSISEGVALASKFSTDKSPKYINGILASVYKEIEKDKNNGKNN